MDTLSISLSADIISKLSENCHHNLIVYCRHAVKEFLEIQNKGHTYIVEMIEEINPEIKLTETEIENLLDLYVDDLKECVEQNWDTCSRDNLYEELEIYLKNRSN